MSNDVWRRNGLNQRFPRCDPVLVRASHRDALEKAVAGVVLHSVCNLIDPPLTKATRAIKEPSFPRRREPNLVGCHQILKTKIPACAGMTA